MKHAIRVLEDALKVHLEALSRAEIVLACEQTAFRAAELKLEREQEAFDRHNQAVDEIRDLIERVRGGFA